MIAKEGQGRLLQTASKSLGVLIVILENNNNIYKQEVGVCEICNRVTLGLTQVEIVKTVTSAAATLIAMEKKMAAGGTVADVLPKLKSRPISFLTPKIPLVTSIHSKHTTTVTSNSQDSVYTSKVAQYVAKFGISSTAVFDGELVYKKTNKESKYQTRFIWIDANDLTFHWSKGKDKTGKSKHVTRTEIAAVNGPVVAINKVSTVARSLVGNSKNETITWNVILIKNGSLDIKMIDGDEKSVNNSRDWVKALHQMIFVFA